MQDDRQLYVIFTLPVLLILILFRAVNNFRLFDINYMFSDQVPINVGV
jgi:ABC-type sugar transport system permease subunit